MSKSINHQLKRLRKKLNPPDHMEQDIINSLKEMGLLKTERKSFSYWRVAAVFALIVSAFFIGYTINLKTADADYNYMLLLYEDDTFISGNADERVREYGAWMRKINAQGVNFTGNELASHGKLLGKNLDAEVRSSGYFFIKARNIDEVIAISNSCPHIKYGGAIEIKEILKH